MGALMFLRLSSVCLVAVLCAGAGGDPELDRAKAAAILAAVNFGDIKTTLEATRIAFMGAYKDPKAEFARIQAYVFGSDAERDSVRATAIGMA